MKEHELFTNWYNPWLPNGPAVTDRLDASRMQLEVDPTVVFENEFATYSPVLEAEQIIREAAVANVLGRTTLNNLLEVGGLVTFTDQSGTAQAEAAPPTPEAGNTDTTGSQDGGGGEASGSSPATGE